MTKEEMIKVTGLTKAFVRKNTKGEKSQKIAVDGVTFGINKGEVFGLLGPNGAGKTTIIRMLTMQTKKTAGSIEYDNLPLEGNEQKLKNIIGIVPQHVNFDNDLTVGNNLELHGRLYHIPTKERQERIQELLAYVGLEDTVNMNPRELSGGMKRRLLIARALIHKPRILFMDEPTVALDPQVRHKIWDLIAEMAADGVTVLLTTHYIEEAEKLCNRVAIINKGHLIDVDTPQSFCQRMGKIAVEWLQEGGRQYRFFGERQQAAEFVATLEDARIRPSNLEDVFIELTGRKEGL